MRAVPTIGACLLLAACAGVEIKRGETSHARREIPPGPGLLTSKQGEFIIYRRQDPAEAIEEKSRDTESKKRN